MLFAGGAGTAAALPGLSFTEVTVRAAGLTWTAERREGGGRRDFASPGGGRAAGGRR